MVPCTMFVRIHKKRIALRPNIWSTAVDEMEKVGIQSKVKVLVCLRILDTSRSPQNVVGEAKM